MEAIKHLQINNYKSINTIDLECSRINVFVGEPNSGKSNILEALDLSYLSKLMLTNETDKKAGFDEVNIKDFLRADKADKLFHLGNIEKEISIISAELNTQTFLRFNNKNDKNIFEWNNNSSNLTEFDVDFNPVPNTQFFNSPIRPYRFKDNIQFHDTGNYINGLKPIFGNNIANVIIHNKSFQETIKNLTEDYGFEFKIDTAKNEIEIQTRINEGLVYSVPYKAIADTFKRLLFHIAAIRYSNASVITLDEPDAHSFPKYVSLLGDEIIEAIDKQFFIATHSPYLLNNLIENTPVNNLAVFVCSYDKKRSETVVKKLSSEDLSELIDYGIDIFFNINKYIDGRIEYSS
jgi:AAA15 family ATPase/GTPase